MRRLLTPGLIAAALVGLAFSPLLVGIEPVGGDPERLYRPVKLELQRALQSGRLPWWSDRFGVGMPLVAESHAAAFYPPNWLLYSLLPVHLAYRLAMWGHHVLMAAGVALYARRLGITPWGAALAAVSFPLCGFQAIHASHEVFYHALAWMPWALVFADRYAVSGRLGDLATLALILGLQWTVGHFQMQTWTALLVVLTGSWTAHGGGRWLWRSMGLLRGVVWGSLIAAVQLVPSWELARFVNQADRPIAERLFYWFPPAHLGEPFTPTLFRSIDPMAPYWFGQGTSGYEACLYVGTIPLLLAFVGLLARGQCAGPLPPGEGGLRRGGETTAEPTQATSPGRSSPTPSRGEGEGRTGRAERSTALALWKLLVPLALALATMPAWWPRGYGYVLSVPVLGAYRAPARYTVIASLGLALLAGAGLDRLMERRRFALGVVLAITAATTALPWSIRWISLAGGQKPLFPHAIDHLLLNVGFCTLGAFLILAWRAKRLPSGVLVGSTLIELTALYYTGPIEWGWPLPLPQGSPVLSLLAQDASAVRIGGLENYPILAGKATAQPYLGFRLPPPNQEMAQWDGSFNPLGPSTTWGARFGISHIVEAPAVPGSIPEGIVWEGRDPLLSRLLGKASRATWLVRKAPRHTDELRAVTRVLMFPTQQQLDFELANESLARDEVGVLPTSRFSLPPPTASRSKIVGWDGRSGDVEHDGSCLLVLTRTYYPGWTYRLNGGPPQPVIPVDGGLQGIPIPGAGRTRVTVAYRPTGIGAAAAMSLGGIGGIAAAVILSYRGARRTAVGITPARTGGSG